jgi:hypothetical protein
MATFPKPPQLLRPLIRTRNDCRTEPELNIMKKLIVFGLDGTLAESKASLDAEMAMLLTALLGIVRVAVISGGNDYPAKEAGVVSIQVRDPDETKRVIEAIVACLGGVQEQTLRKEENR